MIPLIASLVALALAPALYALLSKRTLAHTVLERVILGLLAIAVVFHLLPDSFLVAGWPTLFLAAVGMLVPSILERLWHSMEGSIHWVPLIFAILGLAAHSAMDGAALVERADGTAVLPWAVVLHRIPVGLLLWWTLYPRHGLFLTVGVLLFIGVFTIVGFVTGMQVFQTIDAQYAFALFQALVSGSLLHLAIDRHQH